ncbi:hypothetical protein VOLCADRAFT_103191 [Volvox carteri f. nagariensis]|uniref:RING-type E3 ubiquitin transferase n=1 Tax=Volvox carteri f. nagariensis TaxID=3068 RepID=D8TK32_VOLCA|nr:uncharacterized protein VOLCADRAFT_103191 [Volvox carteri f. nagariensis]EFJ51991.1 hypothetical protein VOLCADRAFT_103191 [Volvox carteri f. nagariensis]|eukprot:XP_002946765.1 hypothetical protein VOLCADRAFT_103191 [Volvox carteri f. nagariensis]
MGSSQSNERPRRQAPPPVPTTVPPTYTTQVYPPPPVFLTAPGQYPPPPTSQQQYYGGTMPIPQPYRPPMMQVPMSQPAFAPHQYGQPPRPVPTQECQTATIRNQVNLKKQTLALEATSQPGIYAITFQFDASAPCRVTTFVCAHEDSRRACKITSPLPPAPAVSYPQGLNHKFPSAPSGLASGHVVNTISGRISARDLTSASNDTFPVIIRLEALGEEAAAEGRSLGSLELGCELPHWVQSQTTYAKLVKEDDGSWGLRVIKQKIWVKGTPYELQEIYGMEQNKAGGNAAAGDGYDDLDGNDCASALKAQTNKCPICRNEIESLLHIKINKSAATAAAAAGQGAAAASSGASA